ncbi:MAG: oligosaccharide flippase family protein [Azonexus sp.]|uniref:oligosaccharide flippase family protein n=1 Tax=Azonexus sp. TaxID=1872668 RepID=UPI0028311294|nr:oligosaccharide flippase family protein [Azonexus sp.]MDR0775289.1 oligosaccharide flippase family protein [Azonexus sp.]
MSTRKALALSFLDRYSGLVIHTASSMAIARLLTPSEIGIYSVTMVLLGFVATFRDLGAGQYLVQNKSLTEEKMRATWSVQLGLGIFLAALVLAAAVPVARFYGEPQMVEIMLVLALNFAITPFLAYPNAWLVREMRFGSIAGVRFVGALVHAASAIGMAWFGFGPVSLAWANALTTVASIVAIWVFACPRLPWRPITRGIGDVVSFGGKLTATSLMNTLSGGAPELLLGKLQSMVDAGLFSRGQGLVTMFQRLVMDAVNSVALPYFARQSREARDLGASFLVAMELITGLGWAFFSGVALMAYPAIRILYGAQWDAAVDPARWLAVACVFSIPAAICSPPLIGIGAINDVLKATLLSMLATVIATVFGTLLGLLQLSQCLIVSGLLSSAFWIVTVRKHIGFTGGAILRVWGKSLLVALGASAASVAVIFHWGWRPNELLFPVLVSGIGGILGAFFMAWASKHQLWHEIQRAYLARSGKR